MHSLFKQTSIGPFLNISALRERLLSLIASIKQAWVQHLLALAIATLLSFALVCTWTLQAHSLSADRIDTKLIVLCDKNFSHHEWEQQA